MKKQFFYAAFALSMMASCTNDDVNVNPVDPTPEDSRVAIELGIDAPTVNAKIDSRATGSVGDVESAKNHWNSQKLYIAMYEKGTNTLATDGDQTIFSPTTHTYIAPKAPAEGENATNVGGIRIYQNGTYADATDNGTLKYEYYPVNGQYDFVGFHVDQTVGDNDVAFDAENKTVSNITITGREDIMGAVTKELVKTVTDNEGNQDDLYPGLSDDDFNDLKENWAYSARTARNGIKPTLKFEHQLARLKFFVRAGSDKTALMVEGEGNNWSQRPNIVVSSTTNEEGETVENTTTEAMYVTGLVAKNLVNKLVMNLGATDENGKTIVKTTAAENATTTNFTLGKYDASSKSIVALEPVAPLYPVSLKKAEEAEGFSGEAVYEETQIGESIMFFPTGTSEKEVTVSLTLQQYLKMTEDETIILGNLKPGEEEGGATYTEADKYTWDYKNQTADVTIYAKSVKNAANGGTVDKFEPGKSYNVYITIYGFERIEVTAELTAWEMGGNIEVDIEDKVSKHDVTYSYIVQNSEGETIENATVKFNGAEEADDDKAITVKNGTKFTYTIEAVGFVTQTATITAGAYDTTTTIKLLTQEEHDAAQNGGGIKGGE